MNKLRKLNKIITLVVFFAILSSNVTIDAQSEVEVTFSEMLEGVYKITGKEVLVPNIRYQLNFTFPNGEKHTIYSDENDELFFDSTSGGGFYKVPDSITVPVGTKIEGIDLSSSKYPGGKITAWDWQVGYRGNDGSNIKKYQTFNTKNINQVADKEGYMIFFLNVADDKVFYTKSGKRHRYQNWSNEGNWKAMGREMMGYRVTDWYFKTLRIKVTDKQEPNMIVRSLELIDKETGKVLDSFRRHVDPLDPLNPAKQKLEKTSNLNQLGAKVEKGKNYTLRSAVQFVSFEEGKFNINKPETMTDKQRSLSTGIKQNKIDVFYSNDELIHVDNQYSNTDTKSSTNKANQELKNLETAIFEWDFTVPDDVNKRGVISVKVPDLYKKVNVYEGDDWGTVNFHVDNKNDIKDPTNDLIAESIELIDANGRSVNKYKYGHQYKLRFNVKNSCKSKSILGLGNSKLQASIAAKVDGKALLGQNLISKNNLEPCKIDYLETNWFRPTGDKIEAAAIINPIHKKEGTNHDTTNDSSEAVFIAENNINNFYVKNVKVTPDKIYTTDKCIQGFTKVILKVGHQGDKPKALSQSIVPVVVRLDGKEVWHRNISIPYNSEQHLEIPLNLPLCKGNREIEVEINPDKRIKEIHPNMPNPYSDNKDKTTVNVEQRNDAVRCSLRSGEKRIWNKTVEWDFEGNKKTRYWNEGYYEPYRNWYSYTNPKTGKTETGWYWDSKWVPGWWSSWSTSSHKRNLTRNKLNLYEELRITNLKIASKEESKELNVANNGNAQRSAGKIKVRAGHGFDIGVVTTYKTNDIESNYPKKPNHLYPKNEYTSNYEIEYYGNLVRRQNPDKPDINPTVSMELPLKVNGRILTQRVVLNEKAKSGSASDHTTYHKLNKRGNNARMFYIPEETKPGTYFIEINTTIEQGISGQLQSCRYFEIEVLPRDTGSSHIIQ